MGQPFKVLDLQAVRRGNLLAQGRVQMGSGLIIRTNFMQGKQGPQDVFPLPAGAKGQGSAWVQVVEFATPELQRAWQAAVMAVASARLAEALNISQSQNGGRYDDF